MSNDFEHFSVHTLKLNGWDIIVDEENKILFKKGPQTIFEKTIHYFDENKIRTHTTHLKGLDHKIFNNIIK